MSQLGFLVYSFQGLGTDSGGLLIEVDSISAMGEDIIIVFLLETYNLIFPLIVLNGIFYLEHLNLVYPSLKLIGIDSFFDLEHSLGADSVEGFDVKGYISWVFLKWSLHLSVERSYLDSMGLNLQTYDVLRRDKFGPFGKNENEISQDDSILVREKLFAIRGVTPMDSAEFRFRIEDKFAVVACQVFVIMLQSLKLVRESFEMAVSSNLRVCSKRMDAAQSYLSGVDSYTRNLINLQEVKGFSGLEVQDSENQSLERLLFFSTYDKIMISGYVILEVILSKLRKIGEASWPTFADLASRGAWKTIDYSLILLRLREPGDVDCVPSSKVHLLQLIRRVDCWVSELASEQYRGDDTKGLFTEAIDFSYELILLECIENSILIEVFVMNASIMKRLLKSFCLEIVLLFGSDFVLRLPSWEVKSLSWNLIKEIHGCKGKDKVTHRMRNKLAKDVMVPNVEVAVSRIKFLRLNLLRLEPVVSYVKESQVVPVSFCCGFVAIGVHSESIFNNGREINTGNKDWLEVLIDPNYRLLVLFEDYIFGTLISRRAPIENFRFDFTKSALSDGDCNMEVLESYCNCLSKGCFIWSASEFRADSLVESRVGGLQLEIVRLLRFWPKLLCVVPVLGSFLSALFLVLSIFQKLLFEQVRQIAYGMVVKIFGDGF